jgi:2-methylisocitrate lyase-like PEP mutase family enzyme
MSSFARLERGGPQADLLPEALRRARAYLEAGADCVFPIALWEADAVAAFVAEAGRPVNILALPRAPSLPELARLGVVRVSHGLLLHRRSMEQLADTVAALAPGAAA